MTNCPDKFSKYKDCVIFNIKLGSAALRLGKLPDLGVGVEFWIHYILIYSQ